jgi:hypothetical protein
MLGEQGRGGSGEIEDGIAYRHADPRLLAGGIGEHPVGERVPAEGMLGRHPGPGPH